MIKKLFVIIFLLIVQVNASSVAPACITNATCDCVGSTTGGPDTIIGLFSPNGGLVSANIPYFCCSVCPNNNANGWKASSYNSFAAYQSDNNTPVNQLGSSVCSNGAGAQIASTSTICPAIGGATQPIAPNPEAPTVNSQNCSNYGSSVNCDSFTPAQSQQAFFCTACQSSQLGQPNSNGNLTAPSSSALTPSDFFDAYVYPIINGMSQQGVSAATLSQLGSNQSGLDKTISSLITEQDIDCSQYTNLKFLLLPKDLKSVVVTHCQSSLNKPGYQAPSKTNCGGLFNASNQTSCDLSSIWYLIPYHYSQKSNLGNLGITNSGYSAPTFDQLVDSVYTNYSNTLKSGISEIITDLIQVYWVNQNQAQNLIAGNYDFFRVLGIACVNGPNSLQNVTAGLLGLSENLMSQTFQTIFGPLLQGVINDYSYSTQANIFNTCEQYCGNDGKTFQGCSSSEQIQNLKYCGYQVNPPSCNLTPYMTSTNSWFYQNIWQNIVPSQQSSMVSINTLTNAADIIKQQCYPKNLTFTWQSASWPGNSNIHTVPISYLGYKIPIGNNGVCGQIQVDTNNGNNLRGQYALTFTNYTPFALGTHILWGNNEDTEFTIPPFSDSQGHSGEPYINGFVMQEPAAYPATMGVVKGGSLNVGLGSDNSVYPSQYINNGGGVTITTS